MKRQLLDHGALQRPQPLISGVAQFPVGRPLGRRQPIGEGRLRPPGNGKDADVIGGKLHRLREQTVGLAVLLPELIYLARLVGDRSASQRRAGLPREQRRTVRRAAREQELEIFLRTRQPPEVALQEASEDVFPDEGVHCQARVGDRRFRRLSGYGGHGEAEDADDQ